MGIPKEQCRLYLTEKEVLMLKQVKVVDVDKDKFERFIKLAEKKLEEKGERLRKEDE